MKNMQTVKETLVAIAAGLLIVPIFGTELDLWKERKVYANTVDNPVTTTSPIKEAYAGGEFVLFLHEDTSITGFGSNVNDVLGMSGGESSNTGQIIQVAEPTGFTHLKARRARAYGYRPDADNPSIYQWVEINRDIITPMEERVKDADWSGRWAPGINHHDGELMIDETGQVWAGGSDYWTHLGTGLGHPYKRYVYNVWNRVLSPKERIILIDGNDEVTYPGFENADTSANVVITTPIFTIPADFDAWDIDTKFNVAPDLPNGIADTNLTIEVLDSAGAVIKTITNPYRVQGSSAFNSNPYSPIEGVVPGDYQLRVTSTNTGWTIRIVERDYFKNGKKVEFSYGSTGRFSVVDENNKIYVHSSGWGQVRSLTSPEFDLVTIDPNSVVAGSYHFAGIDESKRLWTWETTSPTLVNFPNVDGVPFYDTREVLKVSAGGGFTMAIAKVKATGVTEVWTWGSNSYGKLGLDPVPSSTSVPTRIERKGVPLTDIVSVAAGENHSVIVQNTQEGQLVWTAGHNAKGQLGGGTMLNAVEPQLVPGLKDIKKLAVQNTPEVAAVGDGVIYSFGGPKSYPEITNLGRIDASLQDKSFEQWEQTQTIYWRQSIFSRPTGSSFLVTLGDRKAYAFGYGGYAATSINGRGFTPVVIDPAFDGQFGRTLGDLEFANVKDISSPGFAGNLIDENGRIWGWGQGYRSGVRSQANISPDANGNYTYTNGAHPLKFSDGTLVPAIFEHIASDYNAGYAISNTGKLWYITSVISPVNSTWDVNNYVLTDISGGPDSRFMAIDNNGELWHWRRGGVPEKMAMSLYGNSKVIKIAAGLDHSLFITETGQVWGFGNNSYGKLGDGTLINSDVPVKVKNVTNAVEIYAGSDFSAAIDNMGRVWSWGYAAYGSLGNNFSLAREKLSTAVGNDLPVMSLENELTTLYFSQYGNKTLRLQGTIQEKEQEDVTISATMLGVEKSLTIDALSWTTDVYDEVIKQNWEMTWDVSEIATEQNYQSLTKVAGEDTRGGIVEQFFAGGFIIDNEAPVAPLWGDTCIMEDTGPICYTGQHFVKDGTNGVNKPVRLYVQPQQKIGDNKAPVTVQVAYRQKQAYGYPIDYSEWIDVTTKDENGNFYHEFYQGFEGETQVKMRSIDKAGNISSASGEYRYVIITDAGAEVKSVILEPLYTNNDLRNDISIKGEVDSSSSIKSYHIEKRLSGESTWNAVTETRQAWTVADDEVLIHQDLDKTMLGNALYEYKVDLENSVAVGAPLIKTVYTSPYQPASFLINAGEEGIKFTVRTDSRNKNSVLYRVVLVNNHSGEVYSVDKVSDNTKTDLVFDIKEGEAPFSLKETSLKISLIIRGENGTYRTIVYNEDFVNSPSMVGDSTSPTVFFNVANGVSEIQNDGTNAINLNVSASDAVTVSKDLKVQISKDGYKWYGMNSTGIWYENFWGEYMGLYEKFVLGNAPGTYILQARVQDEAGNIGYANTKITIQEEVIRDEMATVTDPNNAPSEDASIYVNKPEVFLDIPKTGNVSEVQFSFDGINWSPWEKIDEYYTKYISFNDANGRKNIFVRYRNESGNISKINPNSDVVKYVYDVEKPDASIGTENGTFIVRGNSVVLNITSFDNLSPTTEVRIMNTDLTMDIGTTPVTSTSPYMLNTDVEYSAFISGLSLNFNRIKLEFKDKSGNTEIKTVRVFSK